MADEEKPTPEETREETEAKDPEETREETEAKEADDVADRHGQPGINREKYARDMKAKDDKIAELQAQLDEKSKTEQGRAELKDELEKLKAEMADERVAHKLEMAGSDDRKKGSTGLKPDGDAGKAEEERVDKILSKYK